MSVYKFRSYLIDLYNEKIVIMVSHYIEHCLHLYFVLFIAQQNCKSAICGYYKIVISSPLSWRFSKNISVCICISNISFVCVCMHVLFHFCISINNIYSTVMCRIIYFQCTIFSYGDSWSNTGFILKWSWIQK